jgi:hypothetical protein
VTIFSPPQWQNVTVIAGMALRTKIPTSTTVYRQGGVWYNVLSPGMSLPDVNACDPSPDGGVMYYSRPTPVSDAGLIADLTAHALTPADPSWTPGTIV